MAKQLNDIRPVGDDDDEVPELDMNKPLGVQANARIVGKVDLPDEERKVARPLGLDIISPDPTQPRREVPPVVRKLAREQGIPEWEQWHQMAEHQAGYEINLKSLLRGEGDGIETEKTGAPLVDGFMSLVALAASIYDKGLVNPITVSARGAGYMIETGERRYQAYKLLYGVLGHKKFSRIAANVVPAVDVWRQAAENGSRKPLNAIGMARQIALLVMALNTDKTYEPFEAFEGKSDREFYAQVADGNTHRIPKGTSERILQATGLKSRNQIAQYRALLDISDDLWTQADEDDWAEGRIREQARPQSHTLTTVNVSDTKPIHPRMSIKSGQGPGTISDPKNYQILNGKETVEYITSESPIGGGLDVLIFHLDPQGRRTWAEVVRGHDLKDLPHPERGLPTGGLNPAHGIDYDRLTSPHAQPQPPVMPKVTYAAIGQGSAGQISQGQRRLNSQGRTFEVMALNGEMASCAEVNSKTGARIPGAPFNILISRLLQMQIVANKDDFSTAPAPTFDAKQAAETIFGGDDETEEAVDNPPSTTPDDEDAPPDWAARGNTVLHKPSNTICRVEGLSWDVIENCWYVRVKSGVGEWADLLVSECVPAIEEASPITPMERHPALNPHNANGVISQEQHKLGSMWNMATDLKMQIEASQITRMKTLTANSVASFLQQDGEEAAYARLEAMYNAGHGVLTAMYEALNTIHNEACEVLRQLADEKRGA